MVCPDQNFSRSVTNGVQSNLPLRNILMFNSTFIVQDLREHEKWTPGWESFRERLPRLLVSTRRIRAAGPISPHAIYQVRIYLHRGLVNNIAWLNDNCLPANKSSYNKRSKDLRGVALHVSGNEQNSRFDHQLTRTGITKNRQRYNLWRFFVYANFGPTVIGEQSINLRIHH